MNRMIEKMRVYPWYAYVANEKGPFNKTGKPWNPIDHKSPIPT